MNFLGILVTIGSLIGAVALFMKDKEDKPIDVYSDYQNYKDARINNKQQHH